MARHPAFVGPSYVAQSPLANQEELINWYTERLESAGATARWALFPTPGFEQLSLGSAGPGSAHFAQNGREFAVIGTTFYEISSLGALTSRGTVAVGSNPATICSNGDDGDQLLITSGNNAYIFTLSTNAFASVPFLAGKATMGDASDGYFFVLDASVSKLYVSDLLDGTDWDPTQFAQRSTVGDRWVSMKVLNGLVYLLGSQTSEAWYNTGGFPFPYAPHPSGRFPFGCAAPFSPRIVAGSLLWLGQTARGAGSIMRVAGFQPESVSTDAVEYAISQYDTIEDAVGDSYEDSGHIFYLLTFPDADITWGFDISTGHWHKRLSWDTQTGEFSAQRALHHAYAFNEHRWLDRESAALLRSSPTLGSDVGGGELRRIRRAPAMLYENRRLYYPVFELYLEPGLGLATGQGSDPQVMLRCSNDGGKTWGPELMRSAGAMGEYGKRVRWLRCGSGRNRVFEVSVSDPIPWRVMDAFIEVSNAQPQRQRQVA